jgi:RHS repeat-associated protein
VSANGMIHAHVSWSTLSAAILTATLYDPNNVQVGSTSNSTLGATSDVNYDLETLPAYPAPVQHYTLLVTATATSASFTGTVNYAATPSVTFALDGGGYHADSTQAPSTRERTLNSLTVPAGTYTYRTTATLPINDPNNPTTYTDTPMTLTETHVQGEYPNLTLTEQAPDGATFSQSGATGSLSLYMMKYTSGAYRWSVTNNSSTITTSYTLTPQAVMEVDRTNTGSAVPTPGSSTSLVDIVADGPGPITSTLTWQQQVFTGGYANLTYTLTDSSNNVLDQKTSVSGSVNLGAWAPAAGTYHLTMLNNLTGGQATSQGYTESTTYPKAHATSATLTLKDPSGNVVATGSAGKPTSLSATATQTGRYNLVVTPVSGQGYGTLSGSFQPPNAESISYDANDHATVIDDGLTRATETLGPSGRVLRRVVTDKATGNTTEDTAFGYADGGDSPAYSKPTSGGAVTTYISDGGGLSAIDVGGTVTYQHANLHGDVVGSSDSGGNFTAITPTDEFGVGAAPSSRLGWLGSKERFSEESRLGIIRMGVRLYDPSLGRFLEVDPVEGGSANAYDYGNADPVNQEDLAGTWPHFKCKWCKSLLKEASRGAHLIEAGEKLLDVYDAVSYINDIAHGDWRRSLVSFVMGAAVGGLCGATVTLLSAGTATAGAIFGCTVAGELAGQWAAGRVKPTYTGKQQKKKKHP